MDDNCFRDTKMCNPEPCSLSHACDHAVQQTLYVQYLWAYCSQSKEQVVAEGVKKCRF